MAAGAPVCPPRRPSPPSPPLSHRPPPTPPSAAQRNKVAELIDYLLRQVLPPGSRAGRNGPVPHPLLFGPPTALPPPRPADPGPAAGQPARLPCPVGDRRDQRQEQQSQLREAHGPAQGHIEGVHPPCTATVHRTPAPHPHPPAHRVYPWEPHTQALFPHTTPRSSRRRPASSGPLVAGRRWISPSPPPSRATAPP